MQLEDGKTYLTVGGYIVTIKKNEHGFFYSDKPNPGVNSSGSSCEKIRGKKYGWLWNDNGTIPSLAPEWTEKLRIVCEFNLPKIPEGYEFADEYPMFRTLKKGEYAHRAGWPYVIPSQMEVDSSLPYIALKKKEPAKESPKHIPFSGAGQYRLANGQIVNLDDAACCKCSDGIKSRSGNICVWSWCDDGRIKGLSFDDHSHLYLVEKIMETDEEVYPKYYHQPDPVKYDKEPILDRTAAPKSYIQYKPEDFTKSYGNYFSDSKKETQMTPETAQKIATSTVSTVGKYGFKAANYFMIEPIVNIAKPILRSFRYAVCVSTLATGFYAYHNPDAVKDTIKSCLPKITVESPEIFKS